MSKTLTPSFRFPVSIPEGVVHPQVKSAIENTVKSVVDLNQAVASLKGQITALQPGTAKVNTANSTTSTENVTVVSGGSSGGTVNNQTGVTSYTTTQTDNGAIIVFADASPVAVTLNFGVTLPWYSYILNQGVGVVTLTPQQGTINGAASFQITSGNFSIVFFDGSNFSATTMRVDFLGETITAINSLVHPSDAALPGGVPTTSQVTVTQVVTGYGRNWGNPGPPTGPLTGGWQDDKGMSIFLTSGTTGIKQGLSLVLNSRAEGDSAVLYGYGYFDGGVRAPSDEGATVATFQSIEVAGYGKFTVASTSGTGDVQPILALVSGNNWLTTGAPLLNITKGSVYGNLSGDSSQFSTTQFDQVATTGLTGSIPLTTAWGVISSPLPGGLSTSDVTYPITVPVELKEIGGTTPVFIVGKWVWLAGGQFLETVQITAVDAPLGGFQNVSFNYRSPNLNAVLFQEGPVSQYISLDANYAFSSGNVRTAYPALASFDGINIVYALYVAGGCANRKIAIGGNEPGLSSATAPDIARGNTPGFHLYPGAETLAAVVSAGTCYRLVANPVAWTAGDSVECPHPPRFGGSALFVNKIQNTPPDPSFGSAAAFIQASGTGIAYGFSLLPLRNLNANEMYTLYGGPLTPPDALPIGGHFQNGLIYDRMPINGGINLRGVDSAQTTATYMAYQNGSLVSYDTVAGNLLFRNGVSGSVTIAKLTTGGTNGTLTVTNGLITGIVNPT